MSKKRLILVVENDPTVRRTIEFILGHNGFRVSNTATAAAGIALVPTLKPDLILLDADLPDQDGIAACTALQADERTASFAVVIMHDKLDDARPRFSAFAQVVGFLPKPFSPEALLVKITGVFQRHVEPSR